MTDTAALFDTFDDMSIDEYGNEYGSDGTAAAGGGYLGEDIDELENVVAEFDDAVLTDVSRTVREEYDGDELDRSEWLDNHQHWIRLYNQKDEPVNPPFRWSSKESMPVLAEACNQFAARAFKAFFPNRNIIKALPVGKVSPQDQERADRISKHMSWQLLTQNRTYKRNKRRLLLSVAVHGSHFTKTYYDPAKKLNRVINVRASDLVVPYGSGPRDIEDLDRKTHVLWLSVERTEKLAETGFFTSACEIFEEGDQRPTTQAADDAEGLHPSNANPDDTQRLCKVLEQHRMLDLDGDGSTEPYIVWVDVQSEEVKRIVRRWEVTAEGERDPVEYFTHYPFVENPDGFYGLGMGHIVGEINTSVNKILRQIMDAATLANVGNHSGFISESVAPGTGEVEMDLGHFKKIPGGDNIGQGIFQFKFPGPPTVMHTVMQELMGRGDRLASVTEMISGQAERVMQPTVVLALIEQAMEQHSAVYEGLLDAWGDELEKLYRLNSKYLDDQEYFAILDIDGQQQGMMSGRGDYALDLQVVPVADPKMATDQQRLTRAEAEYQTAINYYQLLMSAFGPNPAYGEPIYAVARRYMQAMQVDRLDEILVPPPPPEKPERIDDPLIENARALEPIPKIPPAYPDQDHAQHMSEHGSFLQDPEWADRFPPGGKESMERHIQEHIALMYQAMVQQENGGDQGRSGGMAPQPDNAGSGGPAGAASPMQLPAGAGLG